LYNIIEPGHRFIKKRIVASLGFRSVEGALQQLLAKRRCTQYGSDQTDGFPRDVIGHVQFIQRILGIAG